MRHLPPSLLLLSAFGPFWSLCAQVDASAPAQAADEPVRLERIEVTAVPVDASINPLSRPTSGILGDSRSLLDTPRSATTLTPALLENQGIDSLQDLAGYAPGTSAPSSYGLLTTPVVRGDTAETYVNGQRLSFNNYGYLPSFNSVEALDLVRGPGSAVFGAGTQLGGYVNYQTKLPRFDGARTTVTTRLGTWVPGSDGSYGNATVQLDTGAPVNDRLAWRISIEGKGGETFYDANGVDDDRFDAYAALTWKPAPGLTIDANLQYLWQNTPETLGVNRVTQDLIDHAVYQSDSGPVKLSRDRILFSRGDKSEAEVARGQVIVTSEVSPDFKLVNRSLYERVDRERYHQFEYLENVVQDTFENRTEGHWDFEAFAHGQKSIFGLTLRYQGVESLVGYNNIPNYDYGYYDLTDPSRVFSAAAGPGYPNSGFPGPDGHLVDNTDGSYGNTVRSEIYNPAVFWQHDAQLTKTLSATIGLREDFYSVSARDPYNGTPNGSGYRDSTDVNAFSQAYSLLWKAQPKLSFYATHNRVRAFKGSTTGGGVDLGSSGIDDEDFRNQSVLYEIGAKTSLLSDRLFLGTALFHQTRQERAMNGDKNDQRVRGLEFEATYQPTTGLSFFANATVQDGIYEDADVYQAADLVNYTTGVGNWDLVGFSDLLFNGGFRQRFESGFGWALTGHWQSEQNVNIATPGYPQIVIPAQFTIDAGLFYEAKTWGARLDFLNLTNERNWIHNGDAYTGGALISQELPFRIEGSVRVKF